MSRKALNNKMIDLYSAHNLLLIFYFLDLRLFIRSRGKTLTQAYNPIPPCSRRTWLQTSAGLEPEAPPLPGDT